MPLNAYPTSLSARNLTKNSDMAKIMINDGRHTAKVAKNEPKKPACE